MLKRERDLATARAANSSPVQAMYGGRSSVLRTLLVQANYLLSGSPNYCDFRRGRRHVLSLAIDTGSGILIGMRKNAGSRQERQNYPEIGPSPRPPTSASEGAAPIPLLCPGVCEREIVVVVRVKGDDLVIGKRRVPAQSAVVIRVVRDDHRGQTASDDRAPSNGETRTTSLCGPYRRRGSRTVRWNRRRARGRRRGKFSDRTERRSLRRSPPSLFAFAEASTEPLDRKTLYTRRPKAQLR